MEGAPRVRAESEVEPEEGGLTPEIIKASVERALALQTEIKAIVPEYGKVVNLAEYRRLKELSAELNQVLKSIPADMCRQQGLPYHPRDEKLAANVIPFPKEPDYPYESLQVGDGIAVDQEQITANDNRPFVHKVA